jgi:hypothetical protein
MEARALARRQKEFRETVRTAATKTDDDLTDEAAWVHRAELANASKARREAEAAALATENAKVRERVASAAAREDDDLTDEAAWQMRASLAEASEARREEELKERQAAAEREHRRLAQVTTRTDDNLDECVHTTIHAAARELVTVGWRHEMRPRDSTHACRGALSTWTGVRACVRCAYAAVKRRAVPGTCSQQPLSSAESAQSARSPTPTLRYLRGVREWAHAPTTTLTSALHQTSTFHLPTAPSPTAPCTHT